MAKIFSKKALALVLTVAMLMSCMVFSFSADAKIETLFINKFDNPDAEAGNWITRYTGSKVYASGGNTPCDYNEELGAMKLDFTGTTYGADSGVGGNGFYLSGFQVFSQGSEQDKAYGPISLSAGWYKFKLDYSVLEFADDNAVFDLYIAFIGNTKPSDGTEINFYFENTTRTTSRLNMTRNNLVQKRVATFTKADIGKSETIETFVELDDATTGRQMMVLLRANDSYRQPVEKVSVAVDNISIAKCMDGSADLPADIEYISDLMWENSYNYPTATNWASYFTAANPNNANDTLWHTNFHSDTAKSSGNYALQDGNGAIKIGVANYNGKNYVSAYLVNHEFATVPKANTYGTMGGYTKEPSDVDKARGVFRTEEGGNYIIRIDHKLNAFIDSKLAIYDIAVAVATPGNVYLDGNKSASIFDSIHTVATYDWNDYYNSDKTMKETEWVTTTIVINNLPANKNFYILGKANAAHSDSLTGTEVLVDNLKIYKYDPADAPTITYMMGDEVVTTATGLPGMPFTTPDFAATMPEGVEFAGIYADAECTIPAELPETFGNTSATYYIKAVEYLVNDPWSFEDFAHKDHISLKSNIWQGGARQVRNDYGSRNGSNALVLNNENGAKNTSNNTSAARNYFLLKNGSGDYAEVEVGKNYLLTYWVMVPTDAPSDFQGNLWVAAIGDPAQANFTYGSGHNFPNMIFNDETTGYVTVPKDGKWHRVTRFISSQNISKESQTENFTSRDGAVVIGLANMTSDSNLNVLVDDIDLICLDDMVAAEYEGGNDREQMLFETEVDGQKTHLHTNTRTGEGVYTSIRLAAKYKAGSAAGDTIILGGKEYALKERGMAIDIADNAATVGYNKSSVNMISTKADNFETAWDVSEDNEFTFTVRLANISKDVIDQGTEYVYRSIYRVAMDGVYAQYNTEAPMASVPVQGAVSDPFTFADIYGEVAANGGSWFE